MSMAFNFKTPLKKQDKEFVVIKLPLLYWRDDYRLWINTKLSSPHFATKLHPWTKVNGVIAQYQSLLTVLRLYLFVMHIPFPMIVHDKCTL